MIIKTNDCACNDYALLTANTGINAVSTANPMLDGSGSMATVLVAGGLGTIVRSVIIKANLSNLDPAAENPYSSGMVRLFVGAPSGDVDAPLGNICLYKEVAVPEVPQLAAVPLPPPMLKTYEIKLLGGLKLQAGYVLRASTEFNYTFNVFAEGLDWSYPDPLPPVCCNFEQQVAITGNNIVSGELLTTVYTVPAGTNGAHIKNITIKALGSTQENLLRIYIVRDFRAILMREVHVPQTQQSAFEPSFKHVVEMDYYLQAEYSIAVKTALEDSYAVTVESTVWIYPV